MNDTQGPLGFLGGAFDPVHIGHLRGAIAVRERLGLERQFCTPTRDAAPGRCRGAGAVCRCP